MADRYDAKRIADPVHGTIGISELEAAVINTAAFQRLHHVKQLGLAYLVYPGANYSRFSHCVGVCHVAGRLQRSIAAKRAPQDDDEHKVQRIRLAGLLHDIGHYPYSHAFETALKDHYSKKRMRSGSADEDDYEGTLPDDATVEKTPDKEARGDEPIVPEPLTHEEAGKALLENDAELRSAIASSKEFTPDEFFDLFNTESKADIWKLVSSDLDADRMDYMLRTATATGLPYGQIDLDYLVSEICSDNAGRIAFNFNALRAIDQFLIARYFDYRQVSYHKTVAAFEWLLRDVVRALLRADDKLDFTPKGVTDRITDRKWSELTDAFISEKIAKAVGDGTLKAHALKKAQALLDRRPPRLLAGVERLQLSQSDSQSSHNLAVAFVRERLPKLAESCGVPKQMMHLWQKKIRLTEAGARGPFDVSIDPDALKAMRKSARVTRDRRGGGASVHVMSVPQSLTSVLARYDLRMIRVFALLSEDDVKNRANDIAARIVEGSEDVGWTHQRGVDLAPKLVAMDSVDGDGNSVDGGEETEVSPNS